MIDRHEGHQDVGQRQPTSGGQPPDRVGEWRVGERRLQDVCGPPRRRRARQRRGRGCRSGSRASTARSDHRRRRPRSWPTGCSPRRPVRSTPAPSSRTHRAPRRRPCCVGSRRRCRRGCDSAGPDVAGVPVRQSGGMSHGHVASELGAAGGRREHGRFVATRQVADHAPEGEQRLPVDAERIDGNGVERGEHCRHVADHLGTHGAGHRDEAIGPRLSDRLQLGRPGDERWQLRRAPLDAQDVGELVDHRDLAGGVARRHEGRPRPVRGGRSWRARTDR